MTGCKEDPCAGVVCENGFCVEGSCNCEAGYEGTNCETEARAKFIHSNWTNSLFCQSSASAFSTSIAEDAASISAVKVTGLFQASDQVAAQIANDSILIPIQVYGVAYVEGLGILNDSTLNIEFDIVQTGGQRNSCIAVLRKN